MSWLSRVVLLALEGGPVLRRQLLMMSVLLVITSMSAFGLELRWLEIDRQTHPACNSYQVVRYYGSDLGGLLSVDQESGAVLHYTDESWEWRGRLRDTGATFETGAAALLPSGEVLVFGHSNWEASYLHDTEWEFRYRVDAFTVDSLGNCTRTEIPGECELVSFLHVLDNSDVVALGDSGTAIARVGGSWRDETIVGGLDFIAAEESSDGILWAIASFSRTTPAGLCVCRSAVLTRAEDGWHHVQRLDGIWLSDLAVLDSGTVCVVGTARPIGAYGWEPTNPVMLVLDGESFRSPTYAPEFELHRIWQLDDGSLLGVDRTGAFLLLRGEVWEGISATRPRCDRGRLAVHRVDTKLFRIGLYSEEGGEIIRSVEMADLEPLLLDQSSSQPR